jgi:hypothetical protein
MGWKDAPLYKGPLGELDAGPPGPASSNASHFTSLILPTAETNIGKVISRLVITIFLFFIVQYFSLPSSGLGFLSDLEAILESSKLLLLALVVLCLLKGDSLLEATKQTTYLIVMFLVYMVFDWINYLGLFQKSPTPEPPISFLSWLAAGFVSWGANQLIDLVIINVMSMIVAKALFKYLWNTTTQPLASS